MQVQGRGQIKHPGPSTSSNTRIGEIPSKQYEQLQSLNKYNVLVKYKDLNKYNDLREVQYLVEESLTHSVH